MFSSPLLRPARTTLPRRLRYWLGHLMSGPAATAEKTNFAACIFKVDRLGDFILSLSTIRLLLHHFGEERCLLVVSHLAAPIAKREFTRTPLRILPVDAPGVVADLFPLWRKVRPSFGEFRTDIRICLTHQRDVYKDAALSWIPANRELRLTRATFPITAPDGACLDLAAHRQIVSVALATELTLDAVLPSFATVPTSDNGRLLVSPFTSELSRDLPATLIPSALKHWRKRSSAPIDLCVTHEQLPRAEALASACRAAGIDRVSIVRPDGTEDFILRIAEAGAVLATDSAATHIATALDKRLCTIVGGGTYGLCTPWRRSGRQVVVQHHVPCYGCGWECSQPEAYCITQIAPEAVAAALPVLNPS